MCDVGYLCANFSLPRPLCSRVRPDVRDRQTDVRQKNRLTLNALWGRRHNNDTIKRKCNSLTIEGRKRLQLSIALTMNRTLLNRMDFLAVIDMTITAYFSSCRRSI